MPLAIEGCRIIRRVEHIRRRTMPRKFCAISFCTALLAFAALFTSTSAVAQEDCLPPNSFTTPSGWAVTLTEGPVKEGYLYRYTYTVNKSGNGKKYNGGQAPSHFNLAIPNCCPDPINLVGVDHYYESGEGDPTSKWLSPDTFRRGWPSTRLTLRMGCTLFWPAPAQSARHRCA